MDAVQALKVVVVSAAPVSELRGGIPLALALGFPPVWAFILSVAGNLLPVPVLLLGLGSLIRWASRSPGRLGKWMRRYLAWQRRRLSGRFSRFGDIALVLLVALPLPATGAWTGCLAASLFGVPAGKAAVLIAAGVLAAGGLVLAASLGAISLFA